MTWIGVVLGLLAAAVVAATAHALGALTLSGALAATVVGGLTLGAGGWLPAALLILFFATSSAWSRAGQRRKAGIAAGFEKGFRRDAAQVAANGGVAAAFSVALGVGAGAWALAALAGSLAAVTADTWATEIGVLIGARPRRLTDGNPVPAGTSGAVSFPGTVAAAAGAGLIATAAGVGAGDPALAAAVWTGGIVGALADSLLGATVQAIYYCPACEKETERHPRHACGAATRPLRGWPWLGNDGVNLIAAASGAAAAVAVWTIMSRA